MKISSLLSFLYGFLLNFKLSLVGQLGGNEILSLLSFLRISKICRLFKFCQELKKINILYLVFFLAQVLSDVYNNTSSTNMLRGSANILMAIICTNFIFYQFFNRTKNVLFYLIGYIFTSLFFKDITQDQVDLEKMGFFKFTLVPVLNSIILICSYYMIINNKAKLLYFLIIFYILFNLAFDSRSNAVFFLFVMIIYHLRFSLLKIQLKNILPYLAIFTLLFQFIYSIYVYTVLKGDLGNEHSQVQLQRLDNPYNPLNLLLTGRSETYAGVIAALDRPFLGHGSWAEDNSGKYYFYVYLLHNDEDKFINFEGARVIPSHSVLIGSWVHSGLIGLICIIFLIIFFYINFFRLLKDKRFVDSAYYIIFVFYGINFIWTVLFSPLSHIKQTLPIFIGFTFAIGLKYRLNKRKKLDH